MGTLGEQYPKALLPIANEPLISHHLKILRSLGISEIYLVVGHRAKDLIRTLRAKEDYGLKIHFVEQGVSLGSAHALGLLRDRVSRPFVLILGDYYFHAPDPVRLLDNVQYDRRSVISVKREANFKLLSEACELQINEQGRVIRITEKPFAPKSDLKGCGFYALQPEIFDAVARTPRTALRDEYELSVSLQIHIEGGYPVHAEETIAWDSNLTRPEDLLECNLHWLTEHKREALIAEGARVEEEVSLEGAVVGAETRVARHCALRDVVVFDGAVIEEGRDIRNALITPQAIHFMAESLR
jgi:glucose-1-phosphate thymidylyltransferase